MSYARRQAVILMVWDEVSPLDACNTVEPTAGLCYVSALFLVGDTDDYLVEPMARITTTPRSHWKNT
eukprot:c40592_g1_i1 orf=271-471(+)